MFSHIVSLYNFNQIMTPPSCNLGPTLKEIYAPNYNKKKLLLWWLSSIQTIKNTFKFDPKYIYMHRVAYWPETLSQADN